MNKIFTIDNVLKPPIMFQFHDFSLFYEIHRDLKMWIIFDNILK